MDSPQSFDPKNIEVTVKQMPQHEDYEDSMPRNAMMEYDAVDDEQY